MRRVKEQVCALLIVVNDLTERKPLVWRIRNTEQELLIVVNGNKCNDNVVNGNECNDN